MMMLSVNLNKVALLRNARRIGIPSIIRATQICLDARAGGISAGRFRGCWNSPSGMH